MPPTAKSDRPKGVDLVNQLIKNVIPNNKKTTKGIPRYELRVATAEPANTAKNTIFPNWERKGANSNPIFLRFLLFLYKIQTKIKRLIRKPIQPKTGVILVVVMPRMKGSLTFMAP